MGIIGKFLREESGAVSTDWVVVCAFGVGMAIATGSLLGGISTDHSDRIEATMVERGVATY
jgi:Flp pilus assembly pilin Flp